MHLFSFYLLLLLFLIRPTDPILENPFDVKGKKKMGDGHTSQLAIEVSFAE